MKSGQKFCFSRERVKRYSGAAIKRLLTAYTDFLAESGACCTPCPHVLIAIEDIARDVSRELEICGTTVRARHFIDTRGSSATTPLGKTPQNFNAENLSRICSWRNIWRIWCGGTHASTDWGLLSVLDTGALKFLIHRIACTPLDS